MANSSYYWCQLINKRIYLVVWLKNYLFLLIKKIAAMIYILLLLINLQKWYISVKVTINILSFAKVIFNIVIYYNGLSGLVITNNNIFYFLKTCYYYAIF